MLDAIAAAQVARQAEIRHANQRRNNARMSVDFLERVCSTCILLYFLLIHRHFIDGTSDTRLCHASKQKAVSASTSSAIHARMSIINDNNLVHSFLFSRTVLDCIQQGKLTYVD